MTLVPRPLHAPHRCSFTLKSEDPEGFIQGLVLSGWDPSASIAVSFLRQEARALGMVDADRHAEVVRESRAKSAVIERLEREVRVLDAKFDAIDVLASSGFVARKKPGRPVTQVKEKV